VFLPYTKLTFSWYDMKGWCGFFILEWITQFTVSKVGHTIELTFHTKTLGILIWVHVLCQHNITQPMSCVQLPWLQIEYEASRFQHLESLLPNLLLGPWTQLISWMMLWTHDIQHQKVHIIGYNNHIELKMVCIWKTSHTGVGGGCIIRAWQVYTRLHTSEWCKSWAVM
jgi:hypothetical protein